MAWNDVEPNEDEGFVCINCGQVHYGLADICGACRDELETEENEERERKWREENA